MIRAAALALVVLTACVCSAVSQSYSKAAQYLIAQEVAAGCPSGGRFAEAGAVERDLN